MGKTSIIVLSHNTLDYTRLCVESIRTYTELGSYELIVVENGSTDGSCEWLVEQEDVCLLRNEKNLGFPIGCNQGMQKAEGDAFLFLNSDTIVTPNWLNNLRCALFSDESIGAVGCVTNSCSNYQKIPATYADLDEMISFAEKFNCSDSQKWYPWMSLVGFCFLMKREVYERVGGFDEAFSPGNFEDDDLSLRIRAAGYHLLLCQDTFIHHFGGRSFAQSFTDAEFEEKQKEYEKTLERNYEYFSRKWNLHYDYRMTINLVAAFPAWVPAGTRICVVNCGYGREMYYLHAMFPDAEISGVAMHENEISLAGMSFSVKFAGVWENVPEIVSEKQDYIVVYEDEFFAANTERLTKKFSEMLSPNGKIIY